MSIFVNGTNSVPPELQKYLGVPLEEANRLAKEANLPVRLVEVDGQPFSVKPLTQEHLNFRVKDGIVIEVGMS